MIEVWVFLVLTGGHMIEVGGFIIEETCNNTREQVLIQREAIGHGPTYNGKVYELTKHYETTKCFKVWKK